MKKLLTSAAFVALLAATPALAADNTVAPMAPAATDATNPDAMNPAAPANSTDQATPLPGAEPTTPAIAETPAVSNPANPPAAVAAAPGSFVDKQAAEQRLASTWMGKSIYNSADENLGDINDLVIGQNGQIETVIIGVGGFLGIGEKNVGVPFSAINATTDADGNVKLMLQASKEQLDAAPEYMTLAEMKAQSPAPEVAPIAPVEPAPAQ